MTNDHPPKVPGGNPPRSVPLRARGLRNAGMIVMLVGLSLAAYKHIFGWPPGSTEILAGPHRTSPVTFAALMLGVLAGLFQRGVGRLRGVEAAIWAGIAAMVLISPWSESIGVAMTGGMSLGITGTNTVIALSLMVLGQVLRTTSTRAALLITFLAAAPPLVALNGHIMASTQFYGEMSAATAIALVGMWFVCLSRFARQEHMRLALSNTKAGRLIRLQIRLWFVFDLVFLLSVRGFSADQAAYYPLIHTIQLVVTWALVLYFSMRFVELFHGAIRTERVLMGAASTDELTGLATRRVALDYYRNLDGKGSLGVLILDLDHFKRLNDTHGHGVGDAALRSVAASLRQTLRVSDLAVRWGGEEFVLFLRDTSEDRLLQVAEKVRAAIASLPPAAPGAPPVTVSIGAAMARNNNTEALEEVLERADMALYAAKAGGRNRVYLSGWGLPEPASAQTAA